MYKVGDAIIYKSSKYPPCNVKGVIVDDDIVGEFSFTVMITDNDRGWMEPTLDIKYNLPPNTCYWNIREDEIIGYDKNQVILNRVG